MQPDNTFRAFLKRGGRSASAIKRVIAYVGEFEAYLQEYHRKGLDEANANDLEGFVERVEQRPKTSAKGHLWGIAYYYGFTADEEMERIAQILREQRIERRPFLLKDFRGLDPEDVERLAAAGIRNVKQMLDAGRTPEERAALAQATGVAEDVVMEVVKLSDLARIPGIKGVRARLYHDAGVDTVAKMAEWEPEALHKMVATFVERTEFEGIAPLSAEVRYSVEQAQGLPKLVTY